MLLKFYIVAFSFLNALFIKKGYLNHKHIFIDQYQQNLFPSIPQQIPHIAIRYVNLTNDQ